MHFYLKERTLELAEEPFCEDFAQFAIELAMALPVDFVFGADDVFFGHKDGPDEFGRLEKEKVLMEVPVFYEAKPWFYILSKERYELSKPYLPNLPIQRMEELNEGKVFLFVDYPGSFYYEDVRQAEATGRFWRPIKVYEPLTERGRAVALAIRAKGAKGKSKKGRCVIE